MDSPFANLFLALQTQIKDNTSIRWIDQDLGQLDYYNEKPPVAWPCVLIDFDAWNFENMGQHCQTAEGDIILRLAFTPYSHSNNLSPQKEKALAYYEHEFALHQALHTWAPEGFAPLTRVTADTEKREDPIRVRVIRYRTAFEDYSTKPERTVAQPDLIITSS